MIIKLFEDFDINDYLKYLKPIESEIDPFEEEDWDEIEEGDMVFTVDKWMGIEILKYKDKMDMKKYKRLSKDGLFKELVKSRNKYLVKNKIKIEGIFRRINTIKKEIDVDNKLNNGGVKNSNKDFTIDDIEQGGVQNLDIYLIDPKTLLIDKYEIDVNSPTENRIDFDDEGDDFFSKIKKYEKDVRIVPNRITHNIKADSLYHMFFTEFKDLFNNGLVVLGTKNVEESMKKKYNKIIDRKIEREMGKKLEEIKKDSVSIDSKLEYKINHINSRFP